MPVSSLLHDLVTLLDKPIATSSLPEPAQEHDRKGVNKVDLSYGYEVDKVYGHAVELILDLGNKLVSQETTIIDLSTGEPRIVREGLGPIDMLT